MVDADVVIIEQRIGDLLRRADEARAVPGRAGERRDAGPEPRVAAIACRGFQEPERPSIGRAVSARRQARGFPVGAHPVLDLARLLPRGFLGVGDHRPQRQREARMTPVPRRRGPHAADDLADLLQRFAPQRIDVRMASGDVDRLVRGPAEEHGQIVRLHRTERALHVVEAPLVIERLRRRPFLPQDVDILVRARIALRLGGAGIAVPRHLLVGAAGDDVDGDAPAAQLVERRELPRRHGRLREAGAVRDEESELRRDRRGVGRDDLAFRRVGAERDQHAVEAALFLRLCRRFHVVAVEHAAAHARVQFGAVVETDIADKFYAHVLCPFQAAR